MLPTADRRLAAGITGSLTLFVIGWTGLLVPTLIRSIKDVLLAFPDEARVYSGHGEPTTVGRERRSNPFLR